jgi:pilus assembly protein TadC
VRQSKVETTLYTTEQLVAIFPFGGFYFYFILLLLFFIIILLRPFWDVRRREYKKRDIISGW